jgi:RNA polymerase sigma factor (sigma-70 family)
MGIAVNVLRERARWGAREARRSLPQASLTEEQWEAILSLLRVEPGDAQWEAGPVRQALDQLTATQRNILRLRFVEGQSHAEIALSLGISEVASRARVCDALRALRRKLPPEANHD